MEGWGGVADPQKGDKVRQEMKSALSVCLKTIVRSEFRPKKQTRAGWPDAFVKKSPKMKQNPFFVKT
jgi:hypothetical protein